MEANLYPLRLQPVYQTYLWGGRRLREQLGRLDTPDGIVAESWEVTDRPDGMSRVLNGPLAGQSLRALIEADPVAVLGSRVRSTVFPLLIKVLDAADTLSVQVHPNDETAARFGGEAKTEMWYVLDATPDAVVYCGLKPGVTPETFAAAVAENRLQDHLVTLPVRKGDVVFVPGGRVHAIGAGCLLLEVQQNSNTTYRIYDWGRVGADGKPRDLHVAQALQVCRWEDTEAALHRLPAADPAEPRVDALLSTPYFHLDRMIVTEEITLENEGDSFEVVFAVDGDLTLTANGQSVQVPRGASALLPAALRETLLQAAPGTEVVLIRAG